MVRKQAKTENDIFIELAATTQGVVLEKEESVKYLVDTGNLALNYICSGKFIDGGIAGGKITEIFGSESSSKSLIGANILHGCQKLGGYAIMLDCENAINRDFVQTASHLDLKRILIYNPPTLERAFRKIHNVVKAIRTKDKESPITVVYDSITVSPCEREFREADLPDEFSAADFKRVVGANEQPGERAKVCSKELRKLSPMLAKENVTLIVINQTRNKIGVMFGSPTTPGGGGEALKFYASCRLETHAAKKIVRKIENVKDHDVSMGVNININNKKNRAFKPFRGTKGVQLFFDKGMNPLSGLLTPLLDEDRIHVVSGGNFAVNEMYLPDGKEEYKFKSSVERNDIPAKVLLECPKLINATSTEEVAEYLSVFDSAIAQSQAEDIQENEISNSDDEA